MRCYWLLKSEPNLFSWTQQLERASEPWTGVRNHQAKRYLQAMSVGDQAFFYHSNIGREIIGVVEVVRTAYSDPTAESGDWVCVDVRAIRALPRPVTLGELKADPRLATLALLRQPRLSVVPVSDEHWRRVALIAGDPAC